MIAGQDVFHEWKIKEDPTSKSSQKAYFLSGVFLKKGFYCATTLDGVIQTFSDKFGEVVGSEKYDVSLRESVYLRNSQVLVASTEPITFEDESKDFISSIRVFTNINRTFEHFDIAAHKGRITRIRVNYEESKVITTGDDGSIFIYNFESSQDSDQDGFYERSIGSRHTNVALIKKTKLKEKESEKINLPDKREDELKKYKSEKNDEKENYIKKLEDRKAELQALKIKRRREVEEKQRELEHLVYQNKETIAELVKKQEAERLDVKLSNQSDVTEENKKVENLKVSYKKHKAGHKRDIEELGKTNQMSKEDLIDKKSKEVEILKEAQYELNDKINLLKLESNKEKEAIGWLNTKIVDVMKGKIFELKKGIEDLKVHNQHKIKKIKESIENYEGEIRNLERENQHLEEEQTKQKEKKEASERIKSEKLRQLDDVQLKISEIEQKIIKEKKQNQYLEKCKFVLNHKIAELKREMGPIEKTIEELKKHTKKLDKVEN